MRDADLPAGRVLVVDDHHGYRQALKHLLESAQFEVVTAENGLRALLAVEANRFDLILLDVNMPGQDGFDVCATVKAHPRVGATPVVFVTACDDPASRSEARYVGAADHLSKLARESEIMACVQTHATRRRAHLQLDETRNPNPESLWRHAPDEMIEAAAAEHDPSCGLRLNWNLSAAGPATS